ncbi:hypothetical protein PR048_009048 [Dryococelus australis]|uniref:PiggyBac transposable element-derived protein domain-containing protein n=1 Tax=Dryococelus australis TaxID=614101 RepID=A0ABQ9HYU9_9NEOP|nr:hypothetical protein PR048_009048 [Dryococelus australis]
MSFPSVHENQTYRLVTASKFGGFLIPRHMAKYILANPHTEHKTKIRVLGLSMYLSVNGKAKDETFIPLFEQLLEEKTTFVGTLCKNKEEIPKEMMPNKCREIHSSVFCFADNLTLVSYVPKKIQFSYNYFVNASLQNQKGNEQKP